MKPLSRPLTILPQSIVGALLICLVGPTSGWGVDVGGQVNLADKANNQPTLRIQISGNIRPENRSGGFDWGR